MLITVLIGSKYTNYRVNWGVIILIIVLIGGNYTGYSTNWLYCTNYRANWLNIVLFRIYYTYYRTN